MVTDHLPAPGVSMRPNDAGQGTMSRLVRDAARVGWRRASAVRPLPLRVVAEGLTVFGAAVMIGSAIIHLNLWSGSYGPIPTVGPLFLFQGIIGLAAALALASLRRVVLMAFGAVLLVSTAAGLLFSHWFGLFGYKENLAVPYAGMSLVLELGGGALLVVTALITVVGTRTSQGSSPAGRV